MRSVDDGYGSRKFLVTLVAIMATVVLAALEKMDANVALVLSACVSIYNWANVRHHQRDINGVPPVE